MKLIKFLNILFCNKLSYEIMNDKGPKCFFLKKFYYLILYLLPFFVPKKTLKSTLPNWEHFIIAMLNSILLLIAIVPALMCNVVNSMRFDLKSGNPKCIVEEIMSNAMTVGNYSVVNPNEGYPIPDSHKLTVRVCL